MDNAARIHNVLAQLLARWHVVRQVAIDGPLFVCHASAPEWDAYAAIEHPAYPSQYLSRDEDTHEVFIVEFQSGPHDCVVAALAIAIEESRVVRYALAGFGASFDSRGRRFRPDLSFGPRRSAIEVLRTAPLPRRIPWEDFKTLRIDIGVSQAWGMRPSDLDYKAQRIWAHRPGTVYILCIHVDDNLLSGSYKLYKVPAHARLRMLPLQPNATPIVLVPPTTIVGFNATRLLGLSNAAIVPAGFPDPLEIDLYEVLTDARGRLGRQATVQGNQPGSTVTMADELNDQLAIEGQDSSQSISP